MTQAGRTKRSKKASKEDMRGSQKNTQSHGHGIWQA
jgi:hypothetical protein